MQICTYAIIQKKEIKWNSLSMDSINQQCAILSDRTWSSSGARSRDSDERNDELAGELLMRASGNCKEVLVGDGRGEGKKTKQSNTTRGTGNAIAGRGRVWNASNGIVPPTATFYSTSTLVRACRVCVCVARACTRSRGGDARWAAATSGRYCVLSINFGLTANRRDRILSVVEAVASD